MRTQHSHRTVSSVSGNLPTTIKRIPAFFVLILLVAFSDASAQKLSPPLDTAVRYVGYYKRGADSIEVVRIMEASLALPRSRRDSALLLTQQAADLAEASVVNGLHADAAECRHWVGRHALNQGKPELAEESFRRELAMRDKLAGPDHPARANCIDHLGRAIRSRGNAREALPYYRQALELRKRYYAGVDHPDLAGAVNNLALVESNLGHFSAAESLYSESLVMKRRIYTTDDIDLATTINNLGLAQLELGKIDQGAAHLQEGVAMLRRTETDRPVLAAGLTGLARAYYALGRYDTALSLSHEAAGLRAGLFRGDHPALASSSAAVGRLLWKTGDRTEGEKQLREGLTMSERLHPDGHPFTASVMIELGGLLREEKSYAQAQRLLSAALELRRKELEQGHPHIAVALIELARAQIGSGEKKEVEKGEGLLKEAKEILEKNFSGAHPQKAELHQGMAELARARGRNNVALDEYRKAAQMLLTIFPNGHPDHTQVLREMETLK